MPPPLRQKVRYLRVRCQTIERCELTVSAGGVGLTVAITPDAITVRRLSGD